MSKEQIRDIDNTCPRLPYLSRPPVWGSFLFVPESLTPAPSSVYQQSLRFPTTWVPRNSATCATLDLKVSEYGGQAKTAKARKRKGREAVAEQGHMCVIRARGGAGQELERCLWPGGLGERQ